MARNILPVIDVIDLLSAFMMGRLLKLLWSAMGCLAYCCLVRETIKDMGQLWRMRGEVPVPARSSAVAVIRIPPVDVTYLLVAAQRGGLPCSGSCHRGNRRCLVDNH